MSKPISQNHGGIWGPKLQRFAEQLRQIRSPWTRLWHPALGGCSAIFCVLLASRAAIGLPQSTLLVASMGASCVLVFAVSDGPLSQPWAVAGGHVLSAVVGVCCAKVLPNQTVAAALAVGGSILIMQLCRCTHPPGGATALAAVIGGPELRALGAQYVLTPVLSNVAILLIVAWLFHWPTASYPNRRWFWRRGTEFSDR